MGKELGWTVFAFEVDIVAVNVKLTSGETDAWTDELSSKFEGT